MELEYMMWKPQIINKSLFKKKTPKYVYFVMKITLLRGFLFLNITGIMFIFRYFSYSVSVTVFFNGFDRSICCVFL